MISSIKDTDYFLKKFNLKHMFISFDELIIKSFDEGNMHFFITINFEKNINEIENLKKKLNKLNKLLINLDFWSWHIFVSEKHESGFYHVHCLLAIRSCIGYNDVINNNLLFYIRNEYEIDTKVDLCKKFIDVKKSLKYIFKELEKKNNYEIISLLNTKIMDLSILKNQENMFKYINIFFKIKIIEYNDNLLINNDEYNINNINENKEYIIIKKKSNVFNFFKGIKITNHVYSENQIIFIWNLFLILNNLYIYKENIYIKQENYLISYRKYLPIDYLYNNFLDIIYYLKQTLNIHFNNFDESNFYSNFLKNKDEKLDKLKNFTYNKLYPNYYLMEFSDGIYSIIHNKFIKKEKFFEFEKNYLTTHTLKYYNFTYKHISLPTVWLNGVKNVLNIKIENNILIKLLDNIINMQNNNDKNLNNLINLLIYMAYVFHFSSNILNKKNTLYVWGPSNTGKTTLIIDFFINYFGYENIGLLSNNKNFLYQDILDKLVLILDEFDLSSIKTEDFKKLISKELILGEKKNQDPKLIKPTPLIISSNKNIENEVYLDNKDSILNRLKIIHFNTPINENDMDYNIKNKIKDEEAKIIILCNKIYFNYINKKFENIEDIKTNILDKIT